MKLTDGSSYAGRVRIPAGAKYYPIHLDGQGFAFPSEVVKRAWCQGYSPKLGKRLVVVENEFAGVDINDVAEWLPDTPTVPPAPGEIDVEAVKRAERERIAAAEAARIAAL